MSLPRPRRGAVAPMTAVLSIFLLGMVAFAIDLSWAVLAQAELQNAADSAALAGVDSLMANYVTYNLPGQSQANKDSLVTGAEAGAKVAAKQYAAANTAGGVGNLALRDADIECGFTDAGGKYTPRPTYAGYPNTVKVLLRRDAQANTPLRLFFAPVLGIKTMSLTASAAAALHAGTVVSFRTDNGAVPLLPMTYDVDAWNNFLKTGQDPDGSTTKDAAGNPILQVYPSVKATGNFGELSLNDSHNGASTTAAWIKNGTAPSDIQDLIDSDLIPLTKHSPNQWDWQGNPGFKASNVMDVNAAVGKTYLLPLFKPSSADPNNYQAGTGQGSNYNYNIVAFVGIKIMPPSQSNREIVVMPAAVSDANAIFDPTSVFPAGTSSSVTTTFTSSKLVN